MNFRLEQIPERTSKPKANGLTMVMDKGLSLREIQDFTDNGGVYTDFIKFGFGTAFITPKLQEKINCYQENNIKVYFGGTLFEAFAVRNDIDNYIQILKNHNLQYVEISDGCIELNHSKKCDYIKRFKDEGFEVLSEVGSKDAAKVIAPYRWLQQMNDELEAGSNYVIAEARESGNIGLYRDSGEVRHGLIEEILTSIPHEKIIWEAPKKNQQLFFLELLGANANLGNIPPNETIALEAMRLGLRGDSFDFFLEK